MVSDCLWRNRQPSVKRTKMLEGCGYHNTLPGVVRLQGDDAPMIMRAYVHLNKRAVVVFRDPF